MQKKYCTLEINNPNTGESQQYFGNTTGEYASGKGRLFDSQGNLVYLGGFKNNLYNDYGIQYALIDTVHNIDSIQSYKCIYEGFYKDGVPNGEGREYRYDAEYTFEKSKDMNPNLYYEGTFKDGKYCGYGTLYDLESKYEGVFFNGKYNGYGNQWFMHSSKKVYKKEGNFQDGHLNGAGKIYYPDGNIYFEGTYEYGKAISGTSYRTDGSILYKAFW